MAQGSERFIEQVTRLPLAGKVGIALAIVGVLTAGNGYFLVYPKIDETQKALKQMSALESTMIDDGAIASNLAEYRKEKERLEQKLQKALTELPEKANVPEIIEKFYENGEKAGLTINSLEPRNESKAHFYAEIPFVMAVTGNYHEIAVFFDSLRHLKRIVNVTALRISNPRVKDEKEIVDATFTATTFRFLPQKPAGGKR